MAKLLPETTQLNEVIENENFSITFSGEFEPDETLENIEIKSDLPTYINTKNGFIGGKFENEFSLNPNSIKYRNGLDYGISSSFSNIPKNANIYSFETPKTLKKYYTINVAMNYLLLGQNLKIEKQYILPLQGNWDSFQEKLKEYI